MATNSFAGVRKFVSATMLAVVLFPQMSFAKTEGSDACQQAAGELMKKLADETEYRADSWWKLLLSTAAGVYVNPLAGGVAGLYIVVQHYRSQYRSADIERYVGNTLVGEYNEKQCRYMLSLKEDDATAMDEGPPQAFRQRANTQ